MPKTITTKKKPAKKVDLHSAAIKEMRASVSVALADYEKRLLSLEATRREDSRNYSATLTAHHKRLCELESRPLQLESKALVPEVPAESIDRSRELPVGGVATLSEWSATLSEWTSKTPILLTARGNIILGRTSPSRGKLDRAELCHGNKVQVVLTHNSLEEWLGENPRDLRWLRQLTQLEAAERGGKSVQEEPAPTEEVEEDPSDRFPVGSIVEYFLGSQCLLTPTGNIILNHSSGLPTAGDLSREDMLDMLDMLDRCTDRRRPTHKDLDGWLKENGPQSAAWLRELFRLEAEQQPKQQLKGDGERPVVGTVVNIGAEPCLVTPIGNIILNGCRPLDGGYLRSDLVKLAKESGRWRFRLVHNSLDEYLKEFPKSIKYLAELSDLLAQHGMPDVL